MTMMLEPTLELDRWINRMLSFNGFRTAFIPAADVVVTDDEVTVHMDMPGVKVDDLDIELEGEVLSVRGERVYPYGGDNGRTQQRVERGFGRFERSLRVPRGLDPDAIVADLSDGVLTIRIPKPDELKPHRVEIRTADEERRLEAAA